MHHRYAIYMIVIMLIALGILFVRGNHVSERQSAALEKFHKEKSTNFIDP
ncbi:hypothetical protein H0W32_01225 [Patescibacteria group bacterium]|nr:hypothetical protein [Patescibacteria group bacterium]